jgi:ATP-dependent helicase HrpA
VKKHYFDPYWEKERAEVCAFERVTLYGLTLVPRRRVHYGPIDPKAAREVFLRGALVAGAFETRAPFLAHNQGLVMELEALEHKARRRDVLVDEEAIYAFYDRIVPEGIVSGAGFEKWRAQAERAAPRLLYMTRDILMRHAAAGITEAQFPDRIEVGGAALTLVYRFEPGHPLDGVTATVPLQSLNPLTAEPFDWLVPGYIREKVARCIKALPKHLRRHLVPVPQHVTAFLEEQGRETRIEDRGSRIEDSGKHPLRRALAQYVQRVAGEPVAAGIWDGAELPPHLRMNFRVVDDAGRELAAGRDLAALKTQLGEAAQLTFSSAGTGIEKGGIRAWDFGELPAQISFTRGGRRLTGYPALVDEGESVSIRLLDTPAAADAALRGGVRRLMRLALKEQMRQLEKSLPGFTQAALALRGLAPADDWKEDLLTAIADRAFIGDDELPRGADAFESLKQRARTRLPAVREAACRLFAAVAEEHQRVQQRLDAAAKSTPQPAAEVRAQLARLVFRGFLSATPWDRLHDLPRYFKAARLRLDKYADDPERDRRHAGSIAELWRRYEERAAKQRRAGTTDPRLEDFRWRIEELRVSLYAQELKTPYPVSYKRLDKLWTQIRP